MRPLAEISACAGRRARAGDGLDYPLKAAVPLVLADTVTMAAILDLRKPVHGLVGDGICFEDRAASFGLLIQGSAPRRLSAPSAHRSGNTPAPKIK